MIKNLILLATLSLPISTMSCATPGDPTPAVLTQDSAKQEVKDVFDSFKEVINKSNLSAEAKDTILKFLSMKEASVNEKLDLVTKYLMTVKDVDYSLVAKDVTLRLKALYDQFFGEKK